MKFLGIVLIGLAIACCAQQPKTQQKDPLVQYQEGYKDDYPAEYYEEQCKIALKSDIQENWKYDSLTKIYNTNSTFIKDVTSGKYICLKAKDSVYISELFGKNYITEKAIPNGFDSITIIQTYNSDICKLSFFYKGGNNLKKVVWWKN